MTYSTPSTTRPEDERIGHGQVGGRVHQHQRVAGGGLLEEPLAGRRVHQFARGPLRAAGGQEVEVRQRRRAHVALVEDAAVQHLRQSPGGAGQAQRPVQRGAAQVEVHQQHLLAQLARQRDREAGRGRGLALAARRARDHQGARQRPPVRLRQLEVDAPELETQRALHLEPVDQAVARPRGPRVQHGGPDAGADAPRREERPSSPIARHRAQDGQPQQVLHLLGVLHGLVVLLHDQHGPHAHDPSQHERQQHDERAVGPGRRERPRRGLEHAEASAHARVLERFADLRRRRLLDEGVVERPVRLDLLPEPLHGQVAVGRERLFPLVAGDLPADLVAPGLLGREVGLRQTRAHQQVARVRRQRGQRRDGVPVQLVLQLGVLAADQEPHARPPSLPDSASRTAESWRSSSASCAASVAVRGLESSAEAGLEPPALQLGLEPGELLPLLLELEVGLLEQSRGRAPRWSPSSWGAPLPSAAREAASRRASLSASLRR